VHRTKVDSADFEFRGHNPRLGVQPPEMWRFVESRRMTHNIDKAMRADETSHGTQRAHKTCDDIGKISAGCLYVQHCL